MNKSVLMGIGVGVVTALGAAAVAGLNMLDHSPQYAQVVPGTPVKKTMRALHRGCHNVTVTRYRPVQDKDRITGSVFGAVVDGVIGHQSGGGHGRSVATVVGALSGGYTGSQLQEAIQDNDICTTTQQHCKTVHDRPDKMLDYDVAYKIGDQQREIRMDHNPGSQTPLDNNGQLVLNNKA